MSRNDHFQSGYAEHLRQGWHAAADREGDEFYRERGNKIYAEEAAKPGIQQNEDPAGMQYGTNAVWVHLDVLEHHREFDRTGPGHPGSDKTIAALAHDLRSGRGITHPVNLDIHPESGRAILGEGNHRIAAAKLAGWRSLPTTVRRVSSQRPGMTPLIYPLRAEPSHDWAGSPAHEVLPREYIDRTQRSRRAG